MTDRHSDGQTSANVIMPPPLAWALAIALGFGADGLIPLGFLPQSWPRMELGALVFAGAFLFALWGAITIRRAGTHLNPQKPTTAIVQWGPFRYCRNPIYLGMMIGLVGLAVAFDRLWLLIALGPFSLLLRYGVIAREEIYLERRFGQDYLDYKNRVGRWFLTI